MANGSCRRPAAFAVILFAVVLGLNACDRTPQLMERPNMTALPPRLKPLFEKTKTVCFGHFVVEVPATANVVHGPTDVGLPIAGFYWAKNRLASYADSDHVLQRILASTNHGAKVYYRSPSFWQVSTAVNLPSRINVLYSGLLNGFECRRVAYAYSLAVLSEAVFPNSNGVSTFEFPGGYIPRRDG